MAQHIDRSHKLTLTTNTESTTTNPTERKISEIFRSNTKWKSGPQSDRVTEVIANYIVDNLRPLSAIESKAFRNLIEVLESRYQCPSRKTLSESVLPKMKDLSLKKMANETRKMFLLTKNKRAKKVHCNIIYSRKRFLKIKTCSAERRSES